MSDLYSTHWDGCELHHLDCALARLAEARGEAVMLKADRLALANRGVRAGVDASKQPDFRYDWIRSIAARVIAEHDAEQGGK